MSDLLDKDFKSTIIYMFKEVKKTLSEELQESVRNMPHQTGNTNKK
jgi:hypothetical protein